MRCVVIKIMNATFIFILLLLIAGCSNSTENAFDSVDSPDLQLEITIKRMNRLSGLLSAYNTKYGHFPKSDNMSQLYDAIKDMNYIGNIDQSKISKDGWGNEFNYLLDHDRNIATLVSYGPNRHYDNGSSDDIVRSLARDTLPKKPFIEDE